MKNKDWVAINPECSIATCKVFGQPLFKQRPADKFQAKAAGCLFNSANETYKKVILKRLP